MPERGAFGEYAPLHIDALDDVALAAMRVERFVTERIAPAMYRERRPVEVAAWVFCGEPLPFAEAVGQEYPPFAVGDAWGKPWDTVWFRVRGSVPAEWRTPDAQVELVVALVFVTTSPGFQAEATAYRADGSILKAVEPMNSWVPIDADGDEFEVYL